MNNKSPLRTKLPTLITGIVGGVVLIASLGYVQSSRHGWPFSLHHNMAAQPIGTQSEAHSAHENHPVGNAPASQADIRVPIVLDADKAEALGVKVVPVKRETINQSLRAVATIVPDESKVSHVHTRVSGWLENLYVNTTGQEVKQGQPLAAVFSQDLYATQQEYLSALQATQGGPTSVVVDGARTRLKLLGMTDAEISDIQRSKQALRVVTLTSPRQGVVLHRGVSTGTTVDPSTEILTIADLSSVWVLAEVPESSASLVSQGSKATLAFPALPHGQVDASVNFIYPTLTERTRTLRVRFSIANTNGDFRPGLFGTAEFQNSVQEGLVILRDALVDTGMTQHVFVATGNGHYEPRKVVTGARLSDKLEIIEGLQEGEMIASAGVFLLDSESRLRASGGAGTGHSGHGKPAGGEANPAMNEDKANAAPPASHGEHSHNPQGG